MKWNFKISEMMIDSVSRPIIVIVSLLSCECDVLSLEIGNCNHPLGMESGKIKDIDLAASSSYDYASVGPQHARLRGSRGGGAWCPRRPVSRQAVEHLQVDLRAAHLITGARTQGRRGPRGAGREFAEFYTVEYYRTEAGGWVRWKDRLGRSLLTGNTNTYSVVEQSFDPPVIATKFRFFPYSDHVRTVCMRVELLGCQWTEGLMSYATVQGGSYSSLNLIDETYDGSTVGGRLRNGLGQLVDGRKGPDDFRLEVGNSAKGYEWVGWRNDTIGPNGSPLEILFEFDQVRNFTSAHLHTNNMVTLEIQMFSRARAFFGTKPNAFDPVPVYFSHTPDTVPQSRNVTIKLHHRTGKYLKLQLYFTSKWILLSEVTFNSIPLQGNFSDIDEESEAFSEYVSKEYPYQRDEFKITTKATLKPLESYVERPKTIIEHRKQYTNLLIGLLIATIVLLLAAIAFMVARTAKPTPATPLPSVATLPEVKKRPITDDTTITSAIAYPIAEKCQQNASNPFLHVVPIGKLDDRPEILHDDRPPPVPPPPENYVVPQQRLEDKLPLEHCLLPAAMPRAFLDLSAVRCLVRVDGERLEIIEEVGEGKFCRVYLCHVMQSDVAELVTMYTIKEECFKEQFCEEIKTLSQLNHENVAKVLAVCTNNESVIRAYSEYGDLCQFLQDHVAESTAPLVTTASTLSYNCLVHMATQVASAMSYLESHRFVHTDLAARNCLVGRKYTVKISDVGAYRSTYNCDYYFTNERLLPVRWMAWESIYLDKFDSGSDVWSFAVLLWEILTFAREQPFDDFTDQEVMENSARYYRNTAPFITPECPIGCPKDVFALMEECWQRNSEDRPCFREIHLFLQRKNLGFEAK